MAHRKIHRWKDKDIKYGTVKFSFWIHFILVLTPHRLQVSGLETLEIIWPHKLKLRRISSNTQLFPSWWFFLYVSDAYFFLVYSGALSTQQALQRWSCSIMASFHHRAMALWEEGGLNTSLDLRVGLVSSTGWLALHRPSVLRWL